MRILKYALIAMVLVACTKDDPEYSPNGFNGFSSATINGNTLSFKPSMKYFISSGTYGIGLDYFKNNIIKSVIHFGFFSNVLSKQKLNSILNEKKYPLASYATLIGDGDVAGNYYFLNETDTIEDYLLLTSFDDKTGDVKGKFQASFYVDTSLIFDLNSPDTIIITDGYFETTVLK